MTITTEDLVRREVGHCVSYLVATLASGYGVAMMSSDLRDATDQALELASPIDDWEEAAREAGWNGRTEDGTFWNSFDNEVLDNCETYQDVCEECDIEPYQREVFEHWIVSDWLADRLAEKGEKVDKDFAGLTVWARTTTGQGIASDSVIEAIHADLVKEA